jgi:hypothetical protein
MHRNFQTEADRDRDQSLDQFKDLDSKIFHPGRKFQSEVKPADDGRPSKEALITRLSSLLGTDVLYALGVLFIAFLLSFILLRADTGIDGKGIELGTRGYDAQGINAPSVSGLALSAMSSFMFSSRFAPW